MTDSSDTQPLPALHPDHPSRSRRFPEPDPSTTEAIPTRKRRSAARWAVSLLVSCVVIAAACLVGIMTLIYIQARTDEARQVDTIVVLGAAQFNGRPLPVLKARLDQALVLYNAGLAPQIAVTGGNQPGDAFTEAETGYLYLVEHGVPESAIVMENEGRSTWDSLQGLPAVMAPETSPRVLVVSDGFHLFRSELMLRELGYETWGSAATGSPIEPWSMTEFGYVVRETGGVIVFLPEFLW